MNKKKLLQKIFKNQQNIRFEELILIVEMFGFELDRINGSHHIYKKENFEQLINLQNVNGLAKPYQIKQFLALIEKYNLEIPEVK